MSDRFLCMLCDYDFRESTEIEPCPRCGGTQRTNAKYRIEMRAWTPGKTAGGHRKVHELRYGHESVRRDGRRVREFRVIDRRGNRYLKVLVEVGTGKRIHEVDEPLSDHVGRGDARRSRPESQTRG